MQQTLYFQTLAVPSLLPVAKKRPVGSKATERTEPPCPAKVATQVEALSSGDMRHTLAVLSPLPVATTATKSPVGSNATDRTSPLCPAKVATQVADASWK